MQTRKRSSAAHEEMTQRRIFLLAARWLLRYPRETCMSEVGYSEQLRKQWTIQVKRNTSSYTSWHFEIENINSIVASSVRAVPLYTKGSVTVNVRALLCKYIQEVVSNGTLITARRFLRRTVWLIVVKKWVLGGNTGLNWNEENKMIHFSGKRTCNQKV